jgi:hypothetical protein
MRISPKRLFAVEVLWSEPPLTAMIFLSRLPLLRTDVL